MIIQAQRNYIIQMIHKFVYEYNVISNQTEFLLFAHSVTSKYIDMKIWANS